MSLQDEIKDLSGAQRRFFLMRVADLSPEAARQMCGVNQGTYNTWLSRSTNRFAALYQRRDEFNQLYKQEAIQLLRKDNQLAAVLLEQQILSKLQEEINAGIYDLVRTNIARDVYSKLIDGIDLPNAPKKLTWEQKILELTQNNNTLIIARGEKSGEDDQADSDLPQQLEESSPDKTDNEGAAETAAPEQA